PRSNSVIGRMIDKLPIRWTESEVVVGTQKFSASDHIPVLIYPNPLKPKRYVVINSGHPFGDADFRGTNAWLYPRVGDYAVMNPDGTIVVSGFFDERWRLPAGGCGSTPPPKQKWRPPRSVCSSPRRLPFSSCSDHVSCPLLVAA